MMTTLFRDRVEINGIVFNDPLERPLENGVGEWGADVLDGWDDTFDISAEFIGKEVSDGAVASEYFPAEAKPMIAGGYVTASTREIAHQLWDIIVRDAFPRNKALTLVRHEPVPKQMTVRVSGKRTISWVGPLTFRWGVPLTAEDPFKYALAPDVDNAGVAGQSMGGRRYPRRYPLHYNTTFSGTANSVTINNVGTGDSQKFVVSISGPLNRGGWRLANDTTGEFIRFDVALSSTDILEIDFERGLGLLNQYPVTASLTGDFFALVPGPNTLRLYGDYDPAAGFTIVAYSAWE